MRLPSEMKSRGMMRRTALLVSVAAAIACEGSPAPRDVAVHADTGSREAETSSPDNLAAIHWPQDKSAYDLSNIDSLRLSVPSCAGVMVPFTVDSVGPLRPGQTLRDVMSRCTQLLPLWDPGDEGTPTPVLLTRFGAMTVRISLQDTLPASQVASLLSTDSTARTMQGVGPGSTVAELEVAYGRPQYREGECVVYATFPKMQGMSFRLDLRQKFECGSVERDSGNRWSAPSAARVTEVFIYPR